LHFPSRQLLVLLLLSRPLQKVRALCQRQSLPPPITNPLTVLPVVIPEAPVSSPLLQYLPSGLPPSSLDGEVPFFSTSTTNVDFPSFPVGSAFSFPPSDSAPPPPAVTTTTTGICFDEHKSWVACLTRGNLALCDPLCATSSSMDNGMFDTTTAIDKGGGAGGVLECNTYGQICAFVKCCNACVTEGLDYGTCMRTSNVLQCSDDDDNKCTSSTSGSSSSTSYFTTSNVTTVCLVTMIMTFVAGFGTMPF
jgi:hypothetical protein